jgi:hypothetical protein
MQRPNMPDSTSQQLRNRPAARTALAAHKGNDSPTITRRQNHPHADEEHDAIGWINPERTFTGF